jgi:hypothetical protein
MLRDLKKKKRKKRKRKTIRVGRRALDSSCESHDSYQLLKKDPLPKHMMII